MSTICSSALGPAMAPSLLTCPIRKAGMFFFLANFISCPAHSFTCEMEPITASSRSECRVWMESMIRMSGFSLLACCRMSMSCVSAYKKQFSEVAPMRSDRILICSVLSSPDTYRVFWGMPTAICNSRVDFPMPGSPPTRTKEPTTMPPPSTRSSSEILVEYL